VTSGGDDGGMSGRLRLLLILTVVLSIGGSGLTRTAACMPTARVIFGPGGGLTGGLRTVRIGGGDLDFVEVRSASCPVLRPRRSALHALPAPVRKLIERVTGPRDPWSEGRVSVDRNYWISRKTVRRAFRRLPRLPGHHLYYLPVWLTAHEEGSYRFATVAEVCLAASAGALKTRREAARADLERPHVWQWVMPYPASRRAATSQLWRMAFQGINDGATPAIWPDTESRLLHARLVWTPPVSSRLTR